MQSRIIPIPKAQTPAHMSENIQIFDFELDRSEMGILDELDKQERFITYPL